jgi:hypothetical protein
MHSKSITNGTINSSASTLSSVSIGSAVSNPSEPTPTADLDRSDDEVYHYTMNVVNAVRLLLQGVQDSRVDQYLDLVKVINLYIHFRL